MKQLKIMIVGHGRHGKDTAAELIAKAWGYKLTSSSLAAARAIWPALENKPLVGMGSGMFRPYLDVEEAFNDRHNYRSLWFDLISAINEPDKTKLARTIYQTNDIYVGMRCWRELMCCKNAGVYNVCIWVDASVRVEEEASSSMTVKPWMADYILDNNGNLQDLSRNLNQLLDTIYDRYVARKEHDLGNF